MLQRLAAFDCSGYIQTLVVVDHDPEVVTYRLADASHDCQILIQCRIADLGLNRPESEFCRGHSAFGREFDSIKAVAVIGLNWSRVGAEEFYQWRFVNLTQRIPSCHIDASSGHSDQSRITCQAEAFCEHGFQANRRQWFVDDQGCHVVQELLQRLQSDRGVCEQVGMAYHAGTGGQIDQN
ncbi:hypothetical protein D3C79_852740 [compost metagenome]